MQIELDEKLVQMDQLFLLVKKLLEEYRKFRGSGWQQAGREQCISVMNDMRQTAAAAGVTIDDVADTLAQVFWQDREGNVLSELEHVLMELLVRVQQMYLACMHDEASYHKVLLENYYQTAYEKNAVVFYVVYPFLFPGTVPGHTNQVEAKAMTEVLRDMGYNVDLANTRYSGAIAADKYDLVIGSGLCFENLLPQLRADAAAVCYLTESSPYFANPAELMRLRAFERRNGRRLPFERQSVHFLNLAALSEADAAVCVGNAQTASTYAEMCAAIYPIDVTGFTGAFTLDQNEKAAGHEKNFLWYGGAGPVHKGLDLCIEAFRMLPEAALHIVGEAPAEFYDYYREDLENRENIFYYGYLGKEDETFRRVCAQCGWVLSPSCSEGQSTSVITAMAAGMIPVCTKETGLDVEDYGGEWIADCTPEGLLALVRRLLETEEPQVRSRQQQAYELVQTRHSIEHYKNQLADIFSQIKHR